MDVVAYVRNAFVRSLVRRISDSAKELVAHIEL